MKGLINKAIRKFGYVLDKTDNRSRYSDINETEFWEIYELCKPYTMTSVDRMYALYNAVRHVLSADLKGAFVECGVWRGGSSMMIAKMLHNRNITDRKLYLYDTFEGMSEPTEADKDYTGNEAAVLLNEGLDNKETNVWCLASLEDVQQNLARTGFSASNIVYVKGKVEDTIPSQSPQEPIALLRLDTDWYESTKHELEHLYPALASNGVIIIDDYGHWQGCRKAVDEYFQSQKIHLLLNRIDYTGRIGIKS